MSDTETLQATILDGITALATASQAFGGICHELAEAEHAYRQARAKHYLYASVNGEKKTIDHLKAIVDKACDKEMLRVRVAEAAKEGAVQQIFSLRAQLSAAQSLLAKEREEARAVAYGQAAGA